MGERRTPAGVLPTFPASEVAFSVLTAPASSRLPELVTSPVPSVIVHKTNPPSRAPSRESLCTTGPMAAVRARAPGAATVRRTAPSARRTALSAQRREELIAVIIGASTFAICLVAAALFAVYASGPPVRAKARRAERRMELTLSPPAASPILTKAPRRDALASVQPAAQSQKTTTKATAARASSTSSAALARRSVSTLAKARNPARGALHPPARSKPQRGTTASVRVASSPRAT